MILPSTPLYFLKYDIDEIPLEAEGFFDLTSFSKNIDMGLNRKLSKQK